MRLNVTSEERKVHLCFLICLALALTAVVGIEVPFAAYSLPLIGALYFSAKTYLLSPLFLVLGVTTVYFIPRALMLESGFAEPFLGGVIDFTDSLWLLSWFTFLYFFYIGTLVIPRPGRPEHVDFPESNILQLGSVLLFIITLFAFSRYVAQLGGIAGLIKNYSVSNFFYVVADSNLSFYKNLTVWCAFASILVYGVSFNKRKRSFAEAYGSAIACIIIFSILMSMTRRGHLLVGVILVYIIYDLRVKKVPPAILLLSSFLLITLFFLMFILRTFVVADIGLEEALLSTLDRGEFWVLDQYINVVQNSPDLIGFTYGVEHLQSLVFFLFPYQDYNPIDKQLIEASLGVTSWGVPATLAGYAFVVFGWFGLPFYSFLIGLTLQGISYLLLARLTRSRVYFCLYAGFVAMIWYLVRNGDPLTAVFHVNRWLIFALLCLAIHKILSRTLHARGR